MGIGSPFHQGGSSTLSVTDNSQKRETVIKHPAPFDGPVTSQFRAIDTVFQALRHFLDRRNHGFDPQDQNCAAGCFSHERSTLIGIDSSAAIFDLIFTDIHHWHQSGHGGYGDAADSVRRDWHLYRLTTLYGPSWRARATSLVSNNSKRRSTAFHFPSAVQHKKQQAHLFVLISPDVAAREHQTFLLKQSGLRSSFSLSAD